MSALKLYFCILCETESTNISVHRDLSTIHTKWDELDKDQSVGLIHVGFVRPKITKSTHLMKFKGQILATASIKWALPKEYKTSVAVVGEINQFEQSFPIYLVLNGFDYDAQEPSSSYDVSALKNAVNKNTISSAALKVLNSVKRPLNKEEIFANIIEKNLYQFGAKKPVSVLGVELNRYCQGTEYSNPALEALFGKTDDDKFFSLEVCQGELNGWVLDMSINDPTLYNLLSGYGVYDDKSYLKVFSDLPQSLSYRVEFFRFSVEKNLIDKNNLEQLFNILPRNILIADINTLDLSARVLNVFKEQEITCIKKLQKVPVTEMLKWPNFGKGSLITLSKNLLKNVEKLNNQLSIQSSEFETAGKVTSSKEIVEIENNEYNLEIISSTPLKIHFKNALENLKKRDRQIIEYRTGYHGQVKTLEEIGSMFNVTRERIRQLQKKYVDKIIKTECWDDCIAIKIGQLLIERTVPLYLEMLEIEDPWFEGFLGNYQHLAAIIELFSENEIQIINHYGANIVTRIKQDDWETCIRNLRSNLKNKAGEAVWSRADIDMIFKTTLLDKGAEELAPLVWEEFSNSLQFENGEGNGRLIAYGKSAEAAVETVLHQAERPLHFSEIARRASKLFGKTIEDRLAHNALPRLGAKLYGRGIYGLEKFNPISERMTNNIKLVVEHMITSGPLMKQWHSSEITNKLRAQFSALPEELDNYILNIILSNSNKLIYLNRMVWARADSDQNVDDRVDMADAFTKILEDNGAPLKGIEIKKRLAEIRGVQENLQLHPTERMIQVGPDYWGLIDRDVGGTEKDRLSRLDTLYNYLQDTQKGIHVSEVDIFLKNYGFDDEGPSSYALLNLAQRDERFYLGRSMFLGLAEWGDDTRRLNISQAVREILSTMDKPLSINEINARVQDLTGLEVDGTVTNILIHQGGMYNQDLKMWEKKSDK